MVLKFDFLPQLLKPPVGADDHRRAEDPSKLFTIPLLFTPEAHGVDNSAIHIGEEGKV